MKWYFGGIDKINGAGYQINNMRIKSIEIKNFRGFEEKKVSFHEKVNVVIGDNTAGKTTLLKALQVGLGAFLQSLPTLPGGTAYRRNFSKLDRYKPFNAEKRSYIPNPENPSIRVTAECVISSYRNGQKEDIRSTRSWLREFVKESYTSHSKKCASEIIDYAEQLTAIRASRNANVVFPIVLSFGAKRTDDSQYKVVKNVKERLTREEIAYKMALHDKVDYSGVKDWLKRYDKSIKDGKEFEGTREAFYSALQTAIPALSEVDFDGNEIEAIVTISGRTPSRHHQSYMSDGLQSMINIVSEIAHRCIELNGFLGENAVVCTPGVVIVDEVDMYLHPHWQRHILDDLSKAFPQIQFIVSTHSPFIVQSLKSNQLISFDENVYLEGEPYKESLEDIAALRMGMEQNLRSSRFQKMVGAAEELFEAIDQQKENVEQLRKRLISLEAEYSEDPVYLAMVRSEIKSKDKSIIL